MIDILPSVNGEETSRTDAPELCDYFDLLTRSVLQFLTVPTILDPESFCHSTVHGLPVFRILFRINVHPDSSFSVSAEQSLWHFKPGILNGELILFKKRRMSFGKLSMIFVRFDSNSLIVSGTVAYFLMSLSRTNSTRRSEPLAIAQRKRLLFPNLNVTGTPLLFA